ncbi:MAG: ISAzo13 family transposase [Bacteroidetes bacterium]|nr:MAG: ISAzo13 family transposase [Bacteroidota bacterium]
MQTDILIRKKYKKILPHLNERQTRIVLAADAESMGRGGLSKVSKLSGVSRVTLNIGIRELASVPVKKDTTNERIRKEGGGRKKETEKNTNLEKVIEEIVSPHTMGDPMKPLLWTNKSLRNIADAAKNMGYNISHKLAGVILKNSGYSLQGNRKTHEGGKHIDRDTQFNYINELAKGFLGNSDPVISVDCKKKELIGNFKNAGKEWHSKGKPTTVKVYDFIDKNLGKAIPYGVYDVANNEGWVSVGISHDTASFAVSTIRNWWEEMGKEKFSESKRLFITADGGGSNSSRSRLWKIELQVLADEIGKEITVSHFPPGTSKWNKIEHRLFSHITMNWRAKPLTNIQLVVDLIAATKTSKGLKVKSKLDKGVYEKGVKVSDEKLRKINIIKSEFHGEWNYTIKPIL